MPIHNPENGSHLCQGVPGQNPIYSLGETSGNQIYEAPDQGNQYVA